MADTWHKCGKTGEPQVSQYWDGANCNCETWITCGTRINFRKFGNMVIVWGIATRTGGTKDQRNVVTLPSGYRPTSTAYIYFPAMDIPQDGAQADVLLGWVRDDGDIDIYEAEQDVTYDFAAVYPAGEPYLNDNEDVDADSPSGGDILKYNNATSKWENSVLDEINDLSDVNASPTDGQVLAYNATSGEWQSDDPVTQTQADVVRQIHTYSGAASVPSTGADRVIVWSVGASDVDLSLPDASNYVGNEITVIRSDDGAGAGSLKPASGQTVNWKTDSDKFTLDTRGQRMTLVGASSTEWLIKEAGIRN